MQDIWYGSVKLSHKVRNYVLNLLLSSLRLCLLYHRTNCRIRRMHSKNKVPKPTFYSRLLHFAKPAIPPSTGTPAPDFPSGPSEAEHLGHLMPDYFLANLSLEGQRAIGLARFDSEQRRGISEGEKKMLARANEILGFQ